MNQYINVKNATFAVALWVVFTALFFFRLSIVEALIPALRLITDLLEVRFAIAEFNIKQSHQEYLFHLRVITHTPLQLYGHQLPGMDVSATTLITHALQHIFLFSLAVMAGVFYTTPVLWRLLTLAVLGLALSLGLDIPFVLLGSIEGLLLENLAPEQLPYHPLVIWSDMLNRGLRLALPLGLSILCVSLSQQHARNS